MWNKTYFVNLCTTCGKENYFYKHPVNLIIHRLCIKRVLVFFILSCPQKNGTDKIMMSQGISELSTGEKNKINKLISTACWLLITLLFKVWKEQKKSQKKRRKQWTISAILWISQKVSQVLIYSQVTMLDDFSEKNDFNYDVKCVSITK